MTKKTALYEEHLKANGKMVDFAGWEMPINYGSQIEEHNIVRTDAGMFDVSHMVAIDIKGEQAYQFLRYLIANDVAKLVDGKALYSCMLNEKGGIIDDLIVYKITDDNYRMVVNASTADKDLNWMEQQITNFTVTLTRRSDLSMIAVQGPNACQKAASVLPQAQKALELKPFNAIVDGDLMVARTGYTGEDGFEITMPSKDAATLWQALLSTGIKPCGLGARDTLRLEAGMNLYGSDMDETTSPLESGLTWTVAMKDDRNFIGRAALEQQKAAGITKKLVGLYLEERGVLRNHQKVIVEGIGEGEITSGSFSPTLGHSIAYARVPKATGDSCFVEMRNKLVKVRVITPYTFVRAGSKVFN